VVETDTKKCDFTKSFYENDRMLLLKQGILPNHFMKMTGCYFWNRVSYTTSP